MDLHKVVEHLVPASHPIMYILSDPLSPTSAPLRSAATHLKELLYVLRERCASIRDAEFDSLLQKFDGITPDRLPSACLEVIRGVFRMAEIMEEDLADFVVGSWTEDEARRWLRRKAIDGEHHVVLELYSPDRVRTLYRNWLSAESNEHRQSIISRLMNAVTSNIPVSPFPPSENLLPPPLMFAAFDILRIQNFMQAVVIAASLHSLVPSSNNDWVSRVWTLLEAEVDENSDSTDGIKLINLEDEVIQAAQLSKVDPSVINRLRDAVKRTLRTQDPVFRLLQARLSTAIQQRLVASSESYPAIQLPARLRTGRLMPKKDITEREPASEPDLVVKGFELPILKANVGALTVSLRNCVSWLEEAWDSVLENGTGI